MGVKGCSHLQAFKKNHKNIESIKWIHSVFVVGVSVSPQSRKTRISNLYCRTCRKRGPFLHACLECVYFGCHQHIREHVKNHAHLMSMDLIYGQIYCLHCGDYVYDSDIDEIMLENKMLSRKFHKRLFESTFWDPTDEERDLLNRRTKKVCITPESTIGLRGLLNLGSTCYMNCIVQALMHTPLLRDYFLTERHQCKGTRATCLVCEVSTLFQEFYGGDCVPLLLNQLLYFMWTHQTLLAGYEQKDAHEFLVAMLELLHMHCTKSMQKSILTPHSNGRCPCIIDQIFSGQMQSDLICQRCNGVSTTIDPCWDISLDLGPIEVSGRPPSSLIDCLERFTRPEHLDSQEIMCSNCGSCQSFTKHLTMKTLPIVICFHLKRFKHTTILSQKVSTVISFPEMLDMTPFLSISKTDSPFAPDNRYCLFAVINHIGTQINIGHYTAFVRHLHDYWYKCDDDKIVKANLPDVLDSEGYMLFYHKHILGYE